ncbi:MAG: hypothetical protein IJT97_07395 [Bacteroidaceae bacterium]|nr:hypothetical protein [Bacteroidaceae bacterium]
MISSLLVLCSCSGGKKDSKVNPTAEELEEIQDEAQLVVLQEIDGDSIIVCMLDNELEHPQAYSFSEAEADLQIKGTLTEGDTLSIFPDSKNRKVKICINVSELRGKWYYDMQQHRGMAFETTGGLSSINTDKISFREWKLLNGKLYLYYVDMQQEATSKKEYEVEEAEIMNLTAEELQLNFLDSIYTCQRQHGLIML